MASPEAPAPPIIETLCAALVSTARGVQGQWFFLGWSPEGLPAACTDVDGLGAQARRELAAFRATRLEPRRVPYASLIPAQLVAVGAAVDYADSQGRKAEDQVRLSILDAAGQQREVALGELALLGGIAAAREPWQTHPERSRAELAVGTVPLYTVFTALPGARADSGLALLFQSTLVGSSNEAAFRSFVRNVIGRLLVLDESTPAADRKGYLEVAGKAAGVPPQGGVLASLLWLRRAGLVAFEDDWLQRLQGRGRRMKSGMLRALRGIGLVEVSDEMLAELADSRPNYDVDGLDLAPMLAMAQEMYLVGRRHLEPGPSAQRGR